MEKYKLVIWFFVVLASCIAPELDNKKWGIKILSIVILVIGFKLFFLD